MEYLNIIIALITMASPWLLGAWIIGKIYD